MKIGPAAGGLTSKALAAQRTPLLAALAVTVVVTGGAALSGVVTGGDVQPRQLLADPAELTGAAWYLGAVSTLNFLVWAGATALYLVVGLGGRHRAPALATALLALAGVSTMLMLDDVFLLHEIAYPWLLGLPEEVVFTIYALVTIAVLVAFRRALGDQPEVGILVVALLAFAGSIVLDVVGGDLLVRRLGEEGLKLFGALGWALFPAKLVLRWLR